MEYVTLYMYACCRWTNTTNTGSYFLVVRQDILFFKKATTHIVLPFSEFIVKIVFSGNNRYYVVCVLLPCIWLQSTWNFEYAVRKSFYQIKKSRRFLFRTNIIIDLCHTTHNRSFKDHCFSYSTWNLKWQEYSKTLYSRNSKKSSQLTVLPSSNKKYQSA